MMLVSRFPVLAVFILLAWFALPAPAFAGDLRAQLRDLADSHGISISGLDRVTDEVARPAKGDLRRRFERLLRDYNFILRHDAAGALTQVRILSRKGAAPKPPGRAKPRPLCPRHTTPCCRAGSIITWEPRMA